MRRATRRPRRAPSPLEKVEQTWIINLWLSIGGDVYVLGTKRKKGDHQGTMQTPGISDLYGFLPPPRYRPSVTTWSDLWVEVKREKGEPSEEQVTFRERCIRAGTPHVMGTANAFIAYLIDGGWLRSDQVAHYRLGDDGRVTR